MTCASEIVHSGQAEEVWLVPCGPRPDKPGLKTPPLHRYVMAEIAVNTMFSPEFYPYRHHIFTEKVKFYSSPETGY